MAGTGTLESAFLIEGRGNTFLSEYIVNGCFLEMGGLKGLERVSFLLTPADKELFDLEDKTEGNKDSVPALKKLDWTCGIFTFGALKID